MHVQTGEYAIITCINYFCLDPLVLIYGFDIRYGHHREGQTYHGCFTGQGGWKACMLDACARTCQRRWSWAAVCETALPRVGSISKCCWVEESGFSVGDYVPLLEQLVQHLPCLLQG